MPGRWSAAPSSTGSGSPPAAPSGRPCAVCHPDRSRPPRIPRMLSERQQDILQDRRRLLPGVRATRVLEGGRGRGGARLEPVDGPQRALGARGRRATSPIRTPPPGRVPDRRGLPPLRRRAAGRAAAAGSARGRPGPLADAPRGRRGDARDDHGALPDHRPAGARHRAPGLQLARAPRRGPAAAAAGGHGHGDRVQRRRHQARLHVRRASRPRAGGVGVELSQRAPGRPRPGRAHDRPDPRRPGALRRRAGLPGPDRLGASPISSSAPARTSTSRARRGCSPRSTLPTSRRPTA